MQNASRCDIYNCTLFGNGTGISQFNSDTSNIYNSILWNEGDQIFESGTGKVNKQFCFIKGGLSSAIEFNDYPEFVDTVNGNFRLKSCSDAIDKGEETFVIGSLDLDGNPFY